jgi:hypothetical protein
LYAAFKEAQPNSLEKVLRLSLNFATISNLGKFPHYNEKSVLLFNPLQEKTGGLRPSFLAAYYLRHPMIIGYSILNHFIDSCF